jgi:hypothetical protein
MMIDGGLGTWKRYNGGWRLEGVEMVRIFGRSGAERAERSTLTKEKTKYHGAYAAARFANCLTLS